MNARLLSLPWSTLIGEIQRRLILHRKDFLFWFLALAGVLEFVLLFANILAFSGEPGIVGQSLYWRIFFGLFMGPAILFAGMWVLYRAPGTITGRFLIMVSLSLTGGQFVFRFGSPLISSLALITLILYGSTVVGSAFIYLMLTFPVNRIWPSRFAPLFWIFVIIKSTGSLLEMMSSSSQVRVFRLEANPLFVPALAPYQPVIRMTIGITGFLLVQGLIAGFVSFFFRFRHAPFEQRQQMKWVLWAFMVLVMAESVFFTLIAGLAKAPMQRDLALFVLAIGQISFIAALTVGVLSYHLFDIDLIIRRTLVYGLLMAVVGGFYILVVSLLGELFHLHENLLLSLAATGIVAVMFHPLREQLQRLINRLYFGERDNPYKVLTRLNQRLKTVLAPESVLPTMVETIAHSLKLPYAGISLLKDGMYEVVAEYGGKPDQGTGGQELKQIPLVYQSETVGQLLLAPRRPGELFTPADNKLIASIADQAGLAVSTVRLMGDLQQSRERLITAREEERRRLRRDLHDGVGSALAGLSFKVDAATNMLAQNPATASVLLKEIKAQIQAAMADIRRVVYDLRPPAVDELGLLGALRQVIQGTNWPGSLTVRLETSSSLPPLPAAVEVAVYRIAVEALTNVARHAHAQNCDIRVSLENSDLLLEIYDDGCGLPLGWQAGVGVTAMRERTSELGGQMQIESVPNEGTRVIASLPVGSHQD